VDTLKNTCNLHNNLRKPIAAIDRFQNKGSFPYYGATGIIDYLNEYRVEGTFVLIGEDGDHYLKFKTQEMTHLVEGKFNVSNHAHILSGKENCSTKWIHYFFCHRDITYFLTRQGAGRFKLNKASLQNLPICVPSPNEQLNIIERIESFNENYNLEKLKLQKLNSLKTGLMQDLLSGKVRVKI
jgi:type I restriction enzyme S subunit